VLTVRIVKRDQKLDALARRVRCEEVGDVVVEERQPSGTEAMGVRAEASW